MKRFKKYPTTKVQANSVLDRPDTNKYGEFTIEVSPYHKAWIKFGAKTLDSVEYETNADIANAFERCLNMVFPEVY